jgi:hypothetical protein
MWLTLATWLILTVASCLFVVARRSTSARRDKKQVTFGDTTFPPPPQHIGTLQSKKAKSKQGKDVTLPPPTDSEGQKLDPGHAEMGSGPSTFIPPTFPPPPIPGPRREVGLPAFPERAAQKERGLPAFGEPGQRTEGGLPAFPEMEVDQETAESPPLRARIEGDHVVVERDIPARPLDYTRQASQVSSGYAPEKQSSGHTIATPYITVNPGPERIVPRRQESDPTHYAAGQPSAAFANYAPPPVPPLPTSLQRQTANPYTTGAMPTPFANGSYGTPPQMPSYTPPQQPAPPMPHRQGSDPTSNRFVQIADQPSASMTRPPFNPWPSQSTAYYTPGSFHQQYPSAPATVGYGQYPPQNQHTPRSHSEYNPYLEQDAQASRQSYYTPPAFSSDPYNPDGLRMPTGYIPEDHAHAVAQANDYLTTQLSQLLYDGARPRPATGDVKTSPQIQQTQTPSPQIGAASYKQSPGSSPDLRTAIPTSQATLATTPPTLPPKPAAIRAETSSSGWRASGSTPPPLPPKPSSPDSIHTSVKHDVTHRTSRPEQEQDDELPGYEDPIVGPSGSQGT